MKVPKRHQSSATRRRHSSAAAAAARGSTGSGSSSGGGNDVSVVDPSTHVGKSFAQWWRETPTKICHLTGREKTPEERREYERLCFGTITGYVVPKCKKSKPFYKVQFDDGDKYQLYEDKFNVEEHLQLFEDHKATRKNKSVHVARDLETQKPIEIKSVKKDGKDTNMFYTTYVRCVDADEEQEEDGMGDDDIPEAKAEEVLEDTEDEDGIDDSQQKITQLMKELDEAKKQRDEVTKQRDEVTKNLMR